MIVDYGFDNFTGFAYKIMKSFNCNRKRGYFMRGERRKER